MDNINIWTDGGCRLNQSDNNYGAWAYTLEYQGRVIEDYQAERNTTNNAQEMKAIIEALKAVRMKDVPITIYSDSSYCVSGATDWIYNWEKNGWKKGRKKNEEILNLELWKELHALRNTFDSVAFIRVKGHADNVGNNRADELVNFCMDQFLLKEAVAAKHKEEVAKKYGF